MKERAGELLRNPRKVFVTAIVGAIALGVTARLSHAYTRTVRGDGQPIAWAAPARLDLAGNPSNSTGLSASDLYSAVVRSLQRWSVASGGGVGFDYWQGTDRETFPVSSETDGLSTLHFASQNPASQLGRGVLALTEVWYDTETGEIMEADVTLNDRDFQFTTDPRDTTLWSGGRAYIENVLTHEFGHAYGFAHSGLLQSTLLYREAKEQAHLSCDDQVGVRAIYGRERAFERSAIVGVVRDPSGSVIFGAQVTVISVERGVALSGGVTNRSGVFSVAGLDPGTYIILVEPYRMGASTLPPFYGTIDPWVCNDREFARTVVGTLHAPRLIHVSPGQVKSVGDIRVRCGSVIQGSDDVALPQDAPDGVFAFFETLRPGSSAEVTLTGMSESLNLRALTFSLFSPIELRLGLRDVNGNPVAAEILTPSYTGDSGFRNWDTSLESNGLVPGDYRLQLSSGWVDSSEYPLGSGSVASEPFLLVVGRTGAPASITGDLPQNPRCRMNESFPAYESPPGEPRRRDTGGGFCASTRNQKMDPPSGGQLLGWWLPFIFMGLVKLGFSAARGIRLRTRKHA